LLEGFINSTPSDNHKTETQNIDLTSTSISLGLLLTFYKFLNLVSVLNCFLNFTCLKFEKLFPVLRSVFHQQLFLLTSFIFFNLLQRVLPTYFIVAYSNLTEFHQLGSLTSVSHDYDIDQWSWSIYLLRITSSIFICKLLQVRELIPRTFTNLTSYI